MENRMSTNWHLHPTEKKKICGDYERGILPDRTRAHLVGSGLPPGSRAQRGDGVLPTPFTLARTETSLACLGCWGVLSRQSNICTYLPNQSTPSAAQKHFRCKDNVWDTGTAWRTIFWLHRRRESEGGLKSKTARSTKSVRQTRKICPQVRRCPEFSPLHWPSRRYSNFPQKPFPQERTLANMDSGSE